ncbi:hypothetical protein [Krasilnikovia sp. MM14-A1259]|uniref:hypothetical protein n=1 Tax=Krasilnikovia sp. MM14-A1259 TaxID=3373539 RepID=UPI00399CA14E
MWTLADPGSDAGRAIGLTPTELTIYQDCGELMAPWRADRQGLFIAHITSSSGGCDPQTRVAWLDKAAGFQLDGRNVVLLDVGGATVARLVASGQPPRPDRESFEVTDAFRRSLDPPAALPARVIPADRRGLLGRWVPVRGGSKAPKQPYLELGADGRWSALDGCNGSQGGWAAGSAGTLLASSGMSTLIGCDNVPVGDWVSSARRAGFDGTTLVLLDQNAKELGRLRRESGADVTSAPAGT